MPYPGGNRLGRAGKPLTHELPRPVDIGSFLEHDRDHRNAELGDRADLLDIGQAAHGGGDRKRQQRVDLDRRQRRRFGDHLHLNVGQVRHSIDRQVKRRVDPHAAD